jgi:hypothetical protein
LINVGDLVNRISAFAQQDSMRPHSLSLRRGGLHDLH